MPAIGITGGIATGKSAFSEGLRRLLPAATFFDADIAARELTDRDAEVRAEISAAFGREIYSTEGHLNRPALRHIVFADPGKKHALEQILHPRIRRQWTIEAESRRDSAELFLADIPLLYETGGELLCNRVIVVACTARTQLQRLMTRSPMEQQAAEQIIAAQMPLPEKMKRADHIIWNNGPLGLLGAQAKTLAEQWRSS